MKNQKKYGLGLVAAGLTAALLIGFNNCGNVHFQTTPEYLQQQHATFLSTSSLSINGGAPYTRDKLVQLSLASPRATDMKISNQSDCSDGSWEPFSSARSWTLTKENSAASVYAQFKAISGDITDCIQASITHDNVAPQAAFVNAPGVVTNRSDLMVSWTSSDNLSGVASTQCVDASGGTSACANSLIPGAASEGNVQVKVRVTDRAGNVSPDFIYSWVYDKTPPVVVFNAQPAALTGSSSAVLAFSANDIIAGVAKLQCSMDSGAFADCSSPMNFSGLNASAHNFRVQAIDKAGNISTPVSSNWTVDMTAPSVAFTQTPPAASNSNQAVFAFTGLKNGQAISIFSCKLDGGNFGSCSSPDQLSGLAQGPHEFSVTGTDSLGNVSSPLKYSWLVDLTPPTLAFTQSPAAVNSLPTANLAWTAADALSGVKMVECQLDSGSFVACANAAALTGLSEGPHKYSVRVTDNAGNQTTASKSWTTDFTLPIVTITSGPQNYVSTVAATFVFSASDTSGISGYECRIDNDAYATCASPFTSANIAEGGHVFYVRATDRAGNVSLPATYMWNLDLTPPIIQIVSSPTAIKTSDHAVIQYKVIDVGSGVNTVQCGLTIPSGSLANCQALATVDLGTLAVGSYGFTIAATDKVGNAFKTVVNFQVTAVPVVCDPFTVGGDAICNGGLVGNIYYLDSAGQAAFKALASKTVDYFIASGIKVNVLLNLKQLFVSTRAFDTGFPVNGGGLIQDNSGNPLYYYFAFDLRTVLKLDPNVDVPGWYQFATLSDDGSVVNITPVGGSETSLVTNDGDHSTRMGCSTQAIYLDDTTRLATHIKYYQGPPTEIALTMLWKRVSGPTDPLDASCGAVGNNTFFGPPPYADMTTSGYGQLVTRGWKVVAPTNFIAPPTP